MEEQGEGAEGGRSGCVSGKGGYGVPPNGRVRMLLGRILGAGNREHGSCKNQTRQA